MYNFHRKLNMVCFVHEVKYKKSGWLTSAFDDPEFGDPELDDPEVCDPELDDSEVGDPELDNPTGV